MAKTADLSGGGESDVEHQKPSIPNVRAVIRQAYFDWFGKDVQETPTVSYVWTADQFGHFGLGFQITFLLGWIAQWLGHADTATLAWLAGLNLLIWIVKEVRDYLVEKKKAEGAKSAFQFNAKEILWNVVTALFYIAAGAVVAAAAVYGSWRPIVAFVVLLAPALAIAYWWLRRKITFQQAGLPYLYRLANFPGDVPKPIVEHIVRLCDPSLPGPNHLVISGPIGAGKTSLAVGIGTEFAFKLGIGRYTSLAKLLELLARGPSSRTGPTEFDDGRTLWPWDCADLLIVDDVDVGLADLSSSSAMEWVAMATEALRSRLPATVKDRRTIWVLGDVEDAEALRDTIASAVGLPGGASSPLVLLRLGSTAKEALAAKMS